MHKREDGEKMEEYDHLLTHVFSIDKVCKKQQNIEIFGLSYYHNKQNQISNSITEIELNGQTVAEGDRRTKEAWTSEVPRTSVASKVVNNTVNSGNPLIFRTLIHRYY